MRDFESRREERRQRMEEWRARMRDRRGYMFAGNHPSGRRWTGVFILLIGIVALLKVSDVIPVEYDWLFTWPTFLVALGLFIGVRHNFRGVSWLILMLVGGAFLIDRQTDISLRPYTWPLVLILLGILLIFRPGRSWRRDPGEKKTPLAGDMPNDPLINPEATDSKEDFVNATSVFGGAKKNILSKNFRGGEIVNIFGGTELNLSQADMNKEAVIEMTTIFGGLKLIIPSNWTVKSDAAVVFGSIEDKRSMPALNEPTDKVLVLKGTVIFGGVDIKSW